MAREISSLDFNLVQKLPDNFIKAVQFFTFLDLVSDGAEIEGFATPSKNQKSIPTSLLSPSNPKASQILTSSEKEYLELAQQDIFLNGQAIRDANNIERIKNTSLAIRTGTQDQVVMTGVNETRRVIPITPAFVHNIGPSVPTGDSQSNAISHQIPKGNSVDDTPEGIQVTLTWASLRRLHPFDGSSQGLVVNEGPNRNDPVLKIGSVRILFTLRNKNNDVINTYPKEVNGVSVGTYAKDYRFEIPKEVTISSDPNDPMKAINDNFPLSIEVRRLDKEYRDVTGANDPFAELRGERRNIYEEGDRSFTTFSFSGLQTFIRNNRSFVTYPKSAYIGLRYNTQQFPNIPKRKFLIRGVKVRIPGAGANNSGTPTVDINNGRIVYPPNYNFSSLTGTRNVEGNRSWTSDPVWILFALLTESYGLDINDTEIDKASFYEASDYCSEFVTTPDGQKPRYSFNGVINTRRKALELIREIAALMRATVFYREGLIKIALDKPETTISYLFTNANVIDGIFNYSGIDRDKKFTQVNVSYFNNDTQELDQISISSDDINADFKSKYGINQTNIQALYTTDKHQALRFGRSILYTNLLESEVVTFDCGLEAAAILEPFDIIKIADRLKESFRSSGRIKSVTSGTVVVVDDSTNTTLGSSGDLFSVIDKNGGVQEVSIQSVSGSTITLSSTLNPLPQDGSIWAIKTGNVQHRKFRISNIKQNDNFTFTITALKYDDNKYTYIENNNISSSLGDAPSSLLDPPDAPSIQFVNEQLVEVNGRAQSEIEIFFAYVPKAVRYQVSYKVNGNGPFVDDNVLTNNFKIKNNVSGTYEFEIRSVNAVNLISETASTSTLIAEGLEGTIQDVTNLTFEESNDDLILRFDQSPDLDVRFGGKVIVKYSTITDGTAELQDANFVKKVDGESDEIIINDYQSGEYFVQFENLIGKKSDNATSIVVNRTINTDKLLAFQLRENPSFNGTTTNMSFSNSLNGLVINTNGNSVITSANNTISYEFQNSIDLGDVFRLHIEPHFKKSLFTDVTLWDSFTDNIDTWPITYFTGGTNTTQESADLTFQVAKSLTSSASTTFNNFKNTDIIARKLNFKILVINNSTTNNLEIEELGINLFFRPRTERSIDYKFNSSDNVSVTNGVLTSSGSGATTVTFNKKFFTGTTAIGGSTTAFNPVVFININNMQSGDFFTVTNVSGTEFTVSIKNGNSFVARQFTYSAFGYGEG